MNKINTWCTDSGLILNKNKTHIMHVNYARNSSSVNHKYLGIEFDNSMTFNSHVDKICGKLNKVCYQLRQLKSKVDLKTLLLVYYANFYSQMIYGIIIWGSSPHANKVFVIQKKAIRIIYGLKRTDSCRPIFTQHKIHTFASAYILEVVKFFRKNQTAFECNKLERPSMYFIRNSKEQYRPLINKYKMCERGLRSMAVRLTNRFSQSNELADVIKNTENISYIGALKVILLEKCYYSIGEAFA